MLLSVIPVVYLGAQAPEQLEIDLHQSDPGDPDPSAALSATLTLRAPNGVETPGLTLTGAPPGSPVVGSLSLVHPWALSDLPMPGDYTVFAVVTLPGGVYRTAPRAVRCLGQFDDGGPPRGPCRVRTVLA